MATNKNRPGRPRKGSGQTKDEHIEVRVDAAEKQAFRDAAELAGLALSAWIRERLRQVAHRELEAHGRQAAFLRDRTPKE
jgi:uncharacterized protein (DUF1778 family)